MTEAEWLACEEPRLMLEFLGERASDRKFRLFGCACCRRLPRLLAQRRICKALEVAERHADGGATDPALADANRVLAGPWISEFDGVEAVGAATARPVDA